MSEREYEYSFVLNLVKNMSRIFVLKAIKEGSSDLSINTLSTLYFHIG